MSEFIRQTPFDNPESAKLFWQQVDKRIKIVIKDECGFDKTYSAIVIAVGTGTADIQLQGATNTITGVKNKSGEALNIGDEILVEAINNSLNNLVIKYKK